MCQISMMEPFVKIGNNVKRLITQYFYNFHNKYESLKPASLLGKILQHRRFPVNFAKFLRAPIL